MIFSELESSEQNGSILQLVPGTYSVWDLKSMSVGHGGSSGSNIILQFVPGMYLVWVLRSIPLGHGGSGVQVTPK